MSIVRPVVTDDLRVIMCMAFDGRASTEQVRAFKQALINCEMVVHSVEVAGSFDFMIEAALPDVATYHARLEEIKGPLARLVTRYETNFVCKRFVRKPAAKQEQAVWVPCQEGLKRVDIGRIDKVTAEGDYMRVHCGSDSWLVHITLHELLNCLGEDNFAHIHRSCVVRRAFIDRLIHEGHHWDARLRDGTTQRISKSHVTAVLKSLQMHSSTADVKSAKDVTINEDGTPINEKELQG